MVVYVIWDGTVATPISCARFFAISGVMGGGAVRQLSWLWCVVEVSFRGVVGEVFVGGEWMDLGVVGMLVGV